MEKQRRVYSTIGLLFAIVVAVCSLLACNSSRESQVLVKVNGEPILKEDVDALYEQYERTGIDYNEIVENSIRDLVLILWGRERGVSVFDEEVEDMIHDLQESHSAYYDIYLERYGRSGMKEKFRNILFYNKSLEALKEWIKKNLSEDQWATPDKMNEAIERKIDELMSVADVQYCHGTEMDE